MNSKSTAEEWQEETFGVSIHVERGHPSVTLPVKKKRIGLKQKIRTVTKLTAPSLDNKLTIYMFLKLAWTYGSSEEGESVGGRSDYEAEEGMRSSSEEGPGGGLPEDVELRTSGGVWARATLPRGSKFGPFQGKWVPKPLDPRFAWEIEETLAL
ncbi:hypothetical protein AAG570_006099 [Ranatra chinensis]|uniref:Uncharacterized protein n=1 Tax=Ranatra chinensis TaxID=642074 RepID=A0ABD0XX14_9HEMI